MPQPLDPPLALRQPPPLCHPSLTFLRIRAAQAGSFPCRWVTLSRTPEVSRWGEQMGSLSVPLGQGRPHSLTQYIAHRLLSLGRGRYALRLQRPRQWSSGICSPTPVLPTQPSTSRRTRAGEVPSQLGLLLPPSPAQLLHPTLPSPEPPEGLVLRLPGP